MKKRCQKLNMLTIFGDKIDMPLNLTKRLGSYNSLNNMVTQVYNNFMIRTIC